MQKHGLMPELPQTALAKDSPGKAEIVCLC